MKISDQILEVRGSEVESLYNLSKIMNTGLDRRIISILLELLELGVHPDSLVDGETYFLLLLYPNHIYMFLSHFYFLCLLIVVVEDLRSVAT